MASTSPLPDVSSTSDSTSSPQSSSDHPSPDHRIDIHDASVPDKSSTAPQPPPLDSKKQVLESIMESIPHLLKLQRLQRSDRNYQKEASDHKKAVRRLSKDLYMIVSLYALLLGALFAAVAQSTTFACKDLWGPVGIACMVTVGTVCGALDKLRRMGQEKQEVTKSHIRQSAVYDKIAMLYWKGSACRLEELEPEHSHQFSPASIFSLHAILVLGFLVGFSALIITSCARMICSPCRCLHQ